MSTVSHLRRVAALALVLALHGAGSASASSRQPPPPAGLFDISAPAQAVRDAVLPRADARGTRIAARAAEGRYPVDDAQGRTVAISVTSACAASVLLCNSADPQAIASFLGTLVHGDEMSSLNVQITTDPEITSECRSPSVQACYFSGQSRLLISGNDTTGTDGASREFVLAHEYGHHVADNRFNPPFLPTVNYGPKYWTTYEHVCEGVRAGTYVPGAEEGDDYFRNPGEAWAESFAFNRFPDAPVKWAWIDSLKPNAAALAAVTRDTLRPWAGPAKTVFSRRFRKGGAASFTRRIKTPLDGSVVLALSGHPGENLNLILRNGAGRVVKRSIGPTANERINYTACGDRGFSAVVKRAGPAAGRFKLTISRP